MNNLRKIAQEVVDEWGMEGNVCAATMRELRTALAETPLTEHEIELLDGMIGVQLHHAAQCDSIANRTMAVKQKGWDMERVALLRKLKG